MTMRISANYKRIRTAFHERLAEAAPTSGIDAQSLEGHLRGISKAQGVDSALLEPAQTAIKRTMIAGLSRAEEINSFVEIDPELILAYPVPNASVSSNIIPRVSVAALVDGSHVYIPQDPISNTAIAMADQRMEIPVYVETRWSTMKGQIGLLERRPVADAPVEPIIVIATGNEVYEISVPRDVVELAETLYWLGKRMRRVGAGVPETPKWHTETWVPLDFPWVRTHVGGEGLHVGPEHF